ncbi:MAG: hypothetical protein LBG17_03150 [Bacteroidales bacterium]|jgi:hypothetical protein|nr:hypothetical protein [Bacteroidales bacterium]
MATIDNLTSALLGYYQVIDNVQAGSSSNTAGSAEIIAAKDPDYAGVAFTFPRANGFDGSLATAIIIDIDELFTKIDRYTSQKSRFIKTQTAKDGPAVTDTDLYRFSPDERELYIQFLKEGADKVFTKTVARSKKLGYKGYLFDEQIPIVDPCDDSFPYDKGTIVRDNGKYYIAIQDVPPGPDLFEAEYWRETPAEVKPLYETTHKIVYFFEIDNPDKFSQNMLLALLGKIEKALYSFVLWRWYVLAAMYDEAQIWASVFDTTLESIGSQLIIGSSARRKAHLW